MTSHCAFCKIILYDWIQRPPEYLTSLINMRKIENNAYEIIRILLHLHGTFNGNHLYLSNIYIKQYSSLSPQDQRYLIFEWFILHCPEFRNEVNSCIYDLYDLGFFKIYKKDTDLTGIRLWLAYYGLPILQELTQIHDLHSVKSVKSIKPTTSVYGIQVVVHDDYNGLYD